MITKKEQEILDNAPEGATHFLSQGGVGYLTLSDCNLIIGPHYKLSDLRKKQGKTVWDAVNYHKVVWPYENRTHISEGGVCVCDKQEFNQCVKEMAEARWMQCEAGKLSGSFSCYESYKEDYQEPEVKPRMKVEYINVSWNCYSELFVMLESNEHLCTERGDELSLVSLATCIEQGDSIYRKVETEITWQDEVSTMFGNRDDAFSFNERDVKINVLANKDKFIEMCHLVSSMNK